MEDQLKFFFILGAGEMAFLSVADPDPDSKDPHHFAGSGSMIFSMDPDPDQKNLL